MIKQKVDFAFKEIMMNENARIGFLSAMLGIDPKDKYFKLLEGKEDFYSCFHLYHSDTKRKLKKLMEEL